MSFALSITSAAARIPTVARYLTRWLTAVIEPDLEPATYAYYETIARLYVSPALGSIRLDLLQQRDVQAWLDARYAEQETTK